MNTATHTGIKGRLALGSAVAAMTAGMVTASPALAQVTPADPECAVVGQTVTCSGDLSPGVNVTPQDAYDTLIIENLTTDISPAAGVSGIQFVNSGANVNIVTGPSASTITTTGTEAHGIRARVNVGPAIQIDNALDIQTDGGDAHGIFAEGNQSAVASRNDISITNSGSITTQQEGSAGIRVSGRDLRNVMVNNSGDITTLGRLASAIYITTGNLSITNTSLQLVNSGRLSTHGDGAYGIEMGMFGLVDLDSIELRNTGDIEVNGLFSYGISMFAEEFSGVNSGNITLVGNFGAGLEIVSTGTGVSNSFENNGNIIGTGENVTGAFFSGSGRYLNTGEIRLSGPSSTGITAAAQSGQVEIDLINEGVVSTTGNTSGIRGSVELSRSGDSGGSIRFSNSGEVNATGATTHGVVLRQLVVANKALAGTMTVHTEGDISATGDGAFAVFLRSQAGDPLVINADIQVESGATLTGGSGAGGGVSLDGARSGSVVNRGVITAASGVGIIGSQGGDTIVNYGHIEGSVSLGDGDDTMELVAIADQSVTGLIDGQGGTDHFRLSGAGTASLGMGNVSGFETFEKVGASIWTLTGTNAEAASFVVGQGTLINNATAANMLMTVGANGRLEGTGTLGGLVIDGTVAPGNSIGTLNVAGDITFNAGSTYEVEIEAPDQADLISATGTATINGGAVQVTKLSAEASYQDGQTYRIIEAGGGVVRNGDFTFANPFLFLSSDLEYGANYVDIVLTGGGPGQDFTTVAQTFNQLQAATALNELEQSGDALAVYNELLFLTDATEARRAFDLSSGEIYASLLVGSAAQGARRADRLVARGHESKAEGWGLWGGATGRRGSVEGDGNAAEVDHGGYGLDTGIDYRGAGNAWALGAAVGYVDGGLDVDARGSSARYDGWHVGAYGRYGTGNAGLTATAAIDYGRIDARVTRRIAFGNIARTARSNVELDTFALAGELRYGMTVGGGWAVGPVASLRYGKSDLGSLAETGADSLDLSSGGASDGATRFGGGLFANWQGVRGSIDISAQYVDGSGNFAEVPLTLAGAPAQTFGVRSPRTGAAAGLFSIAGRHELGGGWSIGGDARALIGRNEKDVSGSITIGWRF